MDFTAAGLVADVRRRAFIPATSATGSADSDILAHINNRLTLSLPAKIIAAREGFFRQYYDTTLVAGTTRYQLPPRAIGNRVAAILLLDSAGNTLKKLNEIPYSRLTEYSSVSSLEGYLLEADSIVLVGGSIGTAVTLRSVYYIRPNALTTSVNAVAATCAQLGTLAGGAFSATVANYFTAFSTSTRVDVIRGTQPFAHILVGVLPTTASANNLSFTTAQTALCATGDYVCLADFSPFAQIPDAAYPLLSHMSAMSYLSSQGDKANLKSMEDALPKLEAEMLAILSPRVEEGSKKIVSNAGPLGAVGWANRSYRGT